MSTKKETQAPITNVLFEIEEDGQKKSQLTVKDYNFSLTQTSQGSTRIPVGDPVMDQFFIRVTSDGTPINFEWMVNSTKTYDGNIIFYSNGRIVGKIKLTKTYLVGYQQFGSKHEIEELLTLSPGKVEYAKVTFA